MTAPRLRSYEFRREREATWRELERLVARAEDDGVKALSAVELGRLPVVYRATVSSLSVARALSLDRNVVVYLEALCGRAYACVYGVRRTLRETAGQFFLVRFPATVRAHAGPLLLCAAVLLLGALAGGALTAGDLDRFDSFVPEGMAQGRGPTSSTEDLRGILYGTGTASSLATFASFLFAHNAQVGFLAFSLGILVGFPTFLLVLSTGLMLGAFGALYSSRALGPEFWAWILPHGIPELTAIVLCGGAGLSVAGALLFPGEETRLASLARRGRDAGVLVIGAVVLLLFAGLLEGVFRQTVHDLFTRYLMAGVSAALVTTWFAWGAGRRT